MMNFTNLAKTISAGEDEEIWLEIQSYRDTNHVNGFINAAENDKSGDEMRNEFMKLTTLGLMVAFGDFDKLREIF